MRSTATSALVAALLAIAPTDAFWRLPCKAVLVTERADPIVNPGKVAAHAHTIMGGNGFGFDMNYASTQASTCSSCIVTKDFSNYWVPSLYYRGQNGSFTSVDQVGGGLIYYLQRSDPKDPEYSNGLLAFPEGFRMLAGNPALRSFSNTLEQRAINYNCLGTTNAETNELPDYNCPNGLRAQVFFPSCWDGVNLDSDDHKSHMAYPDRVDSGVCPDSHPKRFVSIFYEVIWDTPKFADQWHGAGQPFVFSTGDTTGYGYHGDFVNGWDVPTLQKAVNECTNDSGNVEDCPVFDFFTDEFANSCKIPTSIDEQVFGTLDALPGCNPVTGVGANAVAVTGCGAPTTISAPENPFIDLTVSKKFAYIGCGTDDIGSRTLTGPSEDIPDMTIEKCVDFCISKGYSIAGTEYSTQCYCGDSVPADRAPAAGLMGDCFMKCGGDDTENCGGRGTISLYQKCAAGACQNVSYNVNNSTIGSGGTDTVPGGNAGGVASRVSDSSAAAPAATSAALGNSAATSSPVTVPAASANSAAASSPVTLPAAPAKSAAASSPGAVASATAVAANPPTLDDDAAEPEPITITHTRTVIPLASPTAIAKDAAAQGQCGAATVTVTVAAATVTVTAAAETPFTRPAVKIPVAPQPSLESAGAVVEHSTRQTLASSAPAPVVEASARPTLAPSSARFSNGTRPHGHGHGYGHAHLHSSRPSGGAAQPTAGYPGPRDTGV